MRAYWDCYLTKVVLYLVLGFGVFQTQASEYSIYGPEAFVRYYGSPINESFQITAPSEGEYTLRVHNGWDDTYQVRAAGIKVNGEIIVKPRDLHRGYMDHIFFGDDEWGEAKSGRKWDKYWSRDWLKRWDRSNTIIIDKPVYLTSESTIELIVYGIPKRKASRWERFADRFKRYLPRWWQERLDNGSGLAIEILGQDGTAPVISATANPAANELGWHNQNVTVSFLCEDFESGIAECSDIVSVEEEGENQTIVGTATDQAGNQTTATTIINLDKSPARVDVSVVPQANPAGWHNSSVQVSYECQDVLSGVQTCPEAKQIEVEAANQVISEPVLDLAGNMIAAEVTLNIDKSAPVLTRQISATKNTAGWYSSDVTVVYSCNDQLSGLTDESICPQPVTFSQEGAANQDSITLHDKAGNTVTSVEAFNIDKTLPVIVASLSSSPNSNGWFKEPLTISYQCSDTVSGLFSPDACPSSNEVSTDGQGQNIEASVSDLAGNIASVTTVINLDQQKPEVVFLSPVANEVITLSRPEVSIRISDNLKLDQSTLQLTLNGQQSSANCTISSDIATCQLQSDIQGQAELMARISDMAGNEGSATITVLLDSDGDGVADNLDLCPETPANETVNSDGCSQSQLDKDGDGVPNFEDQCPNTVPGTEVEADGCDETQRDTDKDGVIDIEDAFPNDPTETSDLDGDGIGDNTDLDRDGDGISNDYELVSGTDANDANSKSPDLDSDGVPDQFDADLDGDGVINQDDRFPTDGSESADLDGDGIGDNADEDRDGDGISNHYEEQVGTDANDQSSLPTDMDSDGIPDSVDTDRDGDGVENDVDVYPDDIAESSDLDGDGIGDNADPDRDGDGFSDEVEEQLGTDASDQNQKPSDIDEDGIADALDEDMDGDGVANLLDDYPQDGTRSLVPISLFIDSPENGYVTTENEVIITGHFSGPITNIRVEDQDALITDDQFTATVELREGANKITAVGSFVGLNGIRAANATKNIVLDTTPPDIIISSVTDGMVTTSSDITIAGTLDDLRSNLSDTSEPVVTVNGILVPVVDKSFELADYHLRPGLNVINVQATDPQGNSKVEQRKVVYLDDAGQKIIEIAGNNQAGLVEQLLPEELVIKLVDRNNLPISERAVTFKVTEGDGLLIADPTEIRERVVLTDEQGFARTTFRLGQRSGSGKHQVTASSIGFPGVVVFSASAQALAPQMLSSARGNYQTGMIASILGEPLVARVTDENGNAINGVQIKFEVVKGGGSILDQEGNSLSEQIVTSDFDGNASVDFVLGSDPAQTGQNTQQVLASVIGQEETQTSFIAHNLRPGNIEDTTITGIVLDNSNQPLPGVEVAIKGEFFSRRDTLTNEEGQFLFEEAPVGTVHLVIDGSTTTRDGEWPHLMYELVTISGQENTVGMPIYIPQIDYDGGKLAGGDEDIVIPMQGVAGAEVIIPANSMTFPDGRNTGRVMFSQVQTDKVPMPAPNGSVFDVAWTLQPAGIHFDPPARVSLPNTIGGAPGEEMEMFSFDHDLMEWVSIGPGVVTDDGTKITSRLGHGIRHSGWGGAPPPPPDDTCNISCTSSDECYEKTKRNKPCSCDSKFLDGKVKSDQKPDDCITIKCGGNENNDGETPPDTTKPGDCQISKCSGGSPTTEPDDTDKPDPKEKPDNACKSCSGGEVVDANEGSKCGDGSSAQSCWECKDGKCGNQCDASDITSKKSVSVGHNIAPYVENIKDTVKRLSAGKVEIIIKPEATIEASTGEECCKDCEKNDGKPVEYTDHSGSVGLEVGVEAYPGAFDGEYDKIKGILVEYTLTLSAGVEAKSSLKGQVTGKSTECDEETCVDTNATGAVEAAIGAKAEAALDIKSCGSGGTNHDLSDCPKLAGASGGGNIKVSVGGNFHVASKDFCSESCGKAGGNLGNMAVAGSLGFEIKLLDILKYKQEIGFNQKITDGFVIGPFGSCP